MSLVVDARFVAQLLITQVSSDICMTPKTIMDQVHNRTGMLITYGTAWHAKQKALKIIFGSFEGSYNYAPRLL